MSDETRIRILVETPVELDSIPGHAWGRCLKRHGHSVPEIVNDVFVMRQRSVDQWVFPVGAVVQLPSGQAAELIAAGNAEEVTDSLTGLGTFHTSEPMERGVAKAEGAV